MKISIKVANDLATKLYLIGQATNHGSFAPSNKRGKQKITNFLKRRNLPSIPSNYEFFSEFKISILENRRVVLLNFFDEIKNKIESIQLIPLVNKKKSTKLLKYLRKEFLSHENKILLFLKNLDCKSVPVFSVYIMSLPVELAESLGSHIVISSEFDPKIAFAVLLEEVIHGLISLDYLDISNIPELKSESVNGYDDESVVGFLLYNILTFIDYDKKIRDSVVFGWNDGKRKKSVTNLLRKIYKSN